MSLPEQIQKQVDEAKAIVEKHYGVPDESKPEGTPSADSASTEASPAAEVVVPPVVEGNTQQRVDENDESFAQRWRSLQGIYNTTNRELTQQRDRNRQLEELIATMQAPKPEPVQIAQKFLTDADSTEYGNDMVDFARRAAKEEMAPVVGAIMTLREELAALRGVVPTVNRVAANQQQTANEKFFAQLGSRVSDWETINSDPNFHNWLLSADPLTGINRQTYLEDAHRSLNVDRVVSIFSTWKNAAGAITSDVQQRATPNRNASELELQVAPGRSTAATTTSQKQEKVWSAADITKFYEDSRRGVFKGREAERAELERDIFIAQREGRIVRRAA